VRGDGTGCTGDDGLPWALRGAMEQATRGVMGWASRLGMGDGVGRTRADGTSHEMGRTIDDGRWWAMHEGHGHRPRDGSGRTMQGVTGEKFCKRE